MLNGDIKIGKRTFLGMAALLSLFSFANYVSLVDSESAGGVLVVKESSPVGAIMMWGTSTPPSGWIELNGQSTSGYSELANLYGSTVPDLRGEFVRGWSGSSAVDSGRGLLSNQSWSIENITGQFGIARGHDGRNLSYGHGGAVYKGSHIGGNSAEGTNTSGAYLNMFDASRVVKTSNETRPRNVALMYIVKAE